MGKEPAGSASLSTLPSMAWLPGIPVLLELLTLLQVILCYPDGSIPYKEGGCVAGMCPASLSRHFLPNCCDRCRPMKPRNFTHFLWFGFLKKINVYQWLIEDTSEQSSRSFMWMEILSVTWLLELMKVAGDSTSYVTSQWHCEKNRDSESSLRADLRLRIHSAWCGEHDIYFSADENHWGFQLVPSGELRSPSNQSHVAFQTCRFV